MNHYTSKVQRTVTLADVSQTSDLFDGNDRELWFNRGSNDKKGFPDRWKSFTFEKQHMQSFKFLFLIFGKSHKVLREFLYFAQRHRVVHSPLSELHSEPYGAVSSKNY